MQLILEQLHRVGQQPDFGLGPRAQAQVAMLFSRRFMVLHAASELYTVRAVMALALDLGWGPKLRRGATVEDVIEGFAPQSRIPAEWMLPFLAEHGSLRREGDRFFLEGEPELDLKEIRAFADAEVPGHGANFELLDAVLRLVKPFFTEGKSGEQLLFDISVFPLWLAFFRNENLGYLPNNLLAVLALREGLPEGAHILELGGGAGSFAQLLAQDGAEAGYLGRIAEYRFTDVAPAFLRKAQRDLREKAPGLPFRFSTLDINQPFGPQGVEDGSLDAVVGINVVHVAVDLLDGLQRLRGLLKPGGRLILGECMKPDFQHPIFLEFYFKFMKSFTDVHLDPEFRPCSGFMTAEAWVKALRAAGFHNVQRIPDIPGLLEDFPKFYVGALSAEA